MFGTSPDATSASTQSDGTTTSAVVTVSVPEPSPHSLAGVWLSRYVSDPLAVHGNRLAGRVLLARNETQVVVAIGGRGDVDLRDAETALAGPVQPVGRVAVDVHAGLVAGPLHL